MQPDNPLSMTLIEAPARAGMVRPPASSGAVVWWLLAGGLLVISLAPSPRWTALLLFAPVVEEVIFRAGLHETLLRQLARRHAGGALVANVLTALAFAAAHLALRPGLLGGLTVLPSLLIGRVYEQQRRLTPCIALHALFNAAWLLGAEHFT
jgi:membrane protease YdiL (CAAX protease family)